MREFHSPDSYLKLSKIWRVLMRAFISFILVILIAIPVFADAIIGGVEKRKLRNGENQVVDSTTGSGLPNADVSIPTRNYSTKTDEDGRFQLGTKITAPTIMSVNKEGYRPYSLTLNTESTTKPLVVGIEKTTPKDVVVERNMIHLGDNSYSSDSANANDFAAKSVGPFYSKDFMIKNIGNNEDAYLVIGSIIGIDTLTSRQLGQSKVTSAYANPPEVYCNGNKIAEIKINGDGQEIKLPKGIINQGQENDITIKAGKNQFQSAYIDYDDIEFTNLLIEVH